MTYDPSISNCRLDLEDRRFLRQLPKMPAVFRGHGRPDRIDVDWHRHENQGQMGSCQGNDLASVLERLQHVAGRSVQLSRIFAYLATQKIDGLLGNDRGSTISGGAKLALQHGVPPEEMTGYPPRYPGRNERAKILSAENYAAGERYRAASSWDVSGPIEDAMDWIGGGGGISIGIPWYQGIIPRDRIIRRFAPGRSFGGHAVAVLGYDPDFLIGVNSHGDGPFKITGEAWEDMQRHRYTSMIGLAGDADPQPIDWTQVEMFG
jgi:hypothetical protein